SILGSLLAGFLMVPAFGLQNSIYVLAGLNLAIGLFAARIFTPKSMLLRTTALVVLVAVFSQVVMQPRIKFLGYWESNASQLLFYKEGVESTVAVFSAGKDNPKFSTVNGRVEVPTDVHSMRAFYLLGHLPPLLKPDAKNALLLSFGNGIASGTLSTHNIPALDVVELAPEMVDAARQVYTQENRNILEYPGLAVHIEDARNFLLQTGRKFDIITTDATHPSNSSSWTLFTTEFYQGIQQHLTPDGVFLQWLPIHSMAIADYKSILRTYQSVFPNTTLWYTGGSHTLVLATPTRLTKAELEDKLKAVSSQPEVLKDLGDAARIERHWIMNSDQLQQFIGTGRLVTDNNAYFLPINSDMEQLTQMIQQAAVQANP
ncbi:MAG: fused MFS/spermidine synthase, partial [Planctomycetes bacterium]|nr:fused MFS/spermidine synthase [Planctomycetota bacterium]